MTEVFQAIILGIVQGASEFLPISSSGHLIVIPNILGWEGIVDSLSFNVALHLGTSISVIAFFWKDWVRIIFGFLKTLKMDPKKLIEEKDSRLFIFLVVGSIPAALVGVFFKDFIEESLRSNLLVGLMLILFALILFASDKLGRKNKSISSLRLIDSIFVGVAQAIALVPGVSRSGVTISASLFRNFDRESATRFSFLLSTPAIIGATLLKADDILASFGSGSELIFTAGFISALFSGWLAIKILLNFVKNNNFTFFVVYRVILGVTILLLFI